MRCNVGIAPNRFLAKVAASLHKPDGLDIINAQNLTQVFSELKLTDLHGIAERNEARLNTQGIYTPLQFLDASSEVLKRYVFHSVCGEDWYQRLRGYEIDDHAFSTKTIGRQYVLENSRLNDEAVCSRLAYLCETTGMKLRYKNLCARGIMVYAKYATGDYWYERKMFKTTFFSNAEVYRRAILLFNRRPRDAQVREIGVSCYMLSPSNQNQVSLLDEINQQVWLSEAVDRINEQFGNFTVTYANSYSSKELVKQKIPFGSTRYFELLCRAD
jgi:DNA polymerase-4